ncbi:inositol-3-phosphate synthase [Haladaptatus halobius]|uniref:inositol-3-phosphate synthase n=1 Tax=Haladaptatus halobius TaxID=2884875 RepID=UPI0034A1C5F7
MVGARAVASGVTDPTGMVTARKPCTELSLPDLDEFVFGGHDIRTGSVLESARRLSENNGTPSAATLSAVEDDLSAIDQRIRTGTALNCGTAVAEMADATPLEADRTVSEIVERIRDDYDEFRRANDLDAVVVVNVASTEPVPDDPERYDSIDAFERAVETDDRDLPASSLYAYAALAEGHPYANFTPSTGSALGGLRELAEREGVPHMGNDGKTGESLVKAALAPMFAGRNLRVRSWEGHNILGNTDGHVLEDDTNKEGKLASKGGILEGILDPPFHNRVRIDYTPSLDDWKTAWDYIHFEGFLDTEMTMQFTWEGSDSALAAPLVLDLVRLLVHADERGRAGLQRQLASFFKSPLDVDEHDLSRQFRRLSEYADKGATGEGEATTEATTD